jgi:hypothetical protein
MGSTEMVPYRATQWRCGPVTRPLRPTAPMRCPARTICPWRTYARLRWKYAVIEIDGSSREIKVRHQDDDSPARREDRLSHCAGEICPQMAALDLTIEDSGGTERTGDPSGSRQPERARPKPGAALRAAGHLATLQDLRLDPGRRRAVGLHKAGRHSEHLTGIPTPADGEGGDQGVSPVTGLEEERH